MTELEASKALVRRLVEIVNEGDLQALEEVASGQIAEAARRWIGPFRESFPDFRMEIRDVIAEGDKVAAHAEQGPGNGRKGMTLTATCDATAPASKQLRRDVAAALSCGPPWST